MELMHKTRRQCHEPTSCTFFANLRDSPRTRSCHDSTTNFALTGLAKSRRTDSSGLLALPPGWILQEVYTCERLMSYPLPIYMSHIVPGCKH